MSSTQSPSAAEPGCNISGLPVAICVDEIEAEYNGLIEDARLYLDQLQKAQSQLEDEVMGHQNTREERDGLEGELADSRQDAQLCLMQLYQVQEELERYLLESRDLENQLIRQGEKLDWLRGQRELLIRMVRLKGLKLRAFVAMDGRIALPALKRQCQP